MNARNTPIVYSGTRAFTLPPKAVRMIAARIPRTTIPVLNASRDPMSAKWRGMKRSFARTEASRGKPVKPVLAASSRMIAVENCTMK